MPITISHGYSHAFKPSARCRVCMPDFFMGDAKNYQIHHNLRNIPRLTNNCRDFKSIRTARSHGETQCHLIITFLPDAAPATEFIIHGRTRNRIAKVGKQRKNHTEKSRTPGKKGKGSKKRPRPMPTPRPQLRTKKTRSSRPTNAPTATANPEAPQGKF